MISEGLNKASHIVFIFSCLALVALGSVRVWNESQPLTSSVPNVAVSGAQPSPLIPGTKLPLLDGVSYEKAPLTVALVVQSQCRYCAASMPFYERVAKMRTPNGLQLVVASKESTQTTTDYLTQRGVQVDAVTMLKNNEFPTTGTPTLVLVNRRGVVIGSWLGQLNARQEAEVTAQITAVLKHAA